jgi:uncharacterized protein with ATP-grasp and redox domains
MKTTLSCLPCFVRQSWETVRLATGIAAKQEKIMRRVLRMVGEMDLRLPPPLMAQRIHRVIREESGCDDPYRSIKNRHNRQMLRLYPQLRQQMEQAEDPFAAAVRLAITGNIIDMGATPDLQDDQVFRAMEQATSAIISTKMIETIRQAADNAQLILYVADNAGEIVLDRLLIEVLGPAKTTLVVKSKPILNDATYEDAVSAGLTEIVSVIENGSDAPGTSLDDAPRSFRRIFNDADVVIAKGQGNYETLNDVSRPVFFLLWVKCPVLAADLDCPVGTAVVHYSRPPAQIAAANGGDVCHVE